MVFGGGVGEHEPSLRARCTAGFGWLGMELDRRANESSRSEETRVSTARSQIGTWVMPVEEPRLAAADGAPLVQEEFKPDPQRHIGGSLSLVPAHAGSLLANGISAKTRAWRMGQTRRQPSHRHLRQCFNEIEPRGARKEALTRWLSFKPESFNEIETRGTRKATVDSVLTIELAVLQ